MVRICSPLLVTLFLVACGRGGEHAIHVSPGAGPENQLDAQPLSTARDTMTVCVFEGSGARAVAAEFDPVSRDTLVEVDPSARVYPRLPPPYADEREWFRQSRIIAFQGRDYALFGRPLAALPEDTRRVGELDGIALYARVDDSPEGPIHLFLPRRPGCELQPYNHVDESASSVPQPDGHSRVQDSADSRRAAPAASTQPLMVCVIREQKVELVRATLDSVTEDTLIYGLRPTHVYPVMAPPFAEDTEWFVEKAPIVINGRRYFMYGLRSAFLPGDVTRVGYYEGIPLFALTEEATDDPGMLLVPVRPGCEFQPYNYSGSLLSG